LVLTSRKLVDTHAHICDPMFDGDRAEVLRRAAAAGVGAVIAVGENIPDAHRNSALCAVHPMPKAGGRILDAPLS
jgi:TatD DNase family protein